jgi:hypothetical protein
MKPIIISITVLVTVTVFLTSFVQSVSASSSGSGGETSSDAVSIFAPVVGIIGSFVVYGFLASKRRQQLSSDISNYPSWAIEDLRACETTPENEAELWDLLQEDAEAVEDEDYLNTDADHFDELMEKQQSKSPPMSPVSADINKKMT